MSFYFKHFLLISLTSLIGCTPNKTTVITSPLIKIEDEGPFFQGPNTIVGDWEFDLAGLSDGAISNSTPLKKAKLTGVKLILSEGLEDGLLQDFTLSLTSPNSSMKKLAFIDEIPKVGEVLNLKIAEDQEEIDLLFRDKNISIVGDFSLTKDYYETLSLSIELSFILEH